MKAPKELPKTISTTTLCWLLGGVSPQYVGRLEREGVLERVERGKYAITSIPAACREARKRSEEPAEYTKAKVDYMRERAAAARAARLEAEGKSPAVAEMQEHYNAFHTYLRMRLLAQPTRVAPRLVGLKTPIEAFNILTADTHEMMGVISGADGKEDLEQWWAKTEGGTIDESEAEI